MDASVMLYFIGITFYALCRKIYVFYIHMHYLFRFVEMPGVTEKLRRFASLRCIDTDQHQIILKAFRIIIIYHLITVYKYIHIITYLDNCFCMLLYQFAIVNDIFLGVDLSRGAIPNRLLSFPGLETEVKAKCCPKELNFWNLPPSSFWGQGATLGYPTVLVGSDGWEHPYSFRNCFEYDLMFAYVWKQPCIWNYAWNVLIPSQT